MTAASSTASRSRQPKGVSTGGQFAAEHRPEASGVSLGDGLASLSPVQIDEVLTELYDEQSRAASRLQSTLNTMHHVAGDREIGRGAYRRWSMSDDEARQRVIEISQAIDPRARQAENVLEFEPLRRKELEEARERSQPYQQEYDRRPWPRFFAVPGGHIHSSMDCSTCNRSGKPTPFSWLTQMSGRTEADVVAEHGAMLCTVCYPSAPTQWTNHYEQLQQAKEAEAGELCPGSGRYYDSSLPNRADKAVSRSATCHVCGKTKVILSSANKLRKHQRADA